MTTTEKALLDHKAKRLAARSEMINVSEALEKVNEANKQMEHFLQYTLVPMAIEHVSAPTFGVQFHPESVLTEHGYDILRNFLKVAR